MEYIQKKKKISPDPNRELPKMFLIIPQTYLKNSDRFDTKMIGDYSPRQFNKQILKTRKLPKTPDLPVKPIVSKQ